MLLTLKSCTQLKNDAVIQHLHAHILKLGFRSDLYVGTALLNAHSIASLEDACVLFDEMPDKNTVTWNIMISGYLRSGDVKRARLVFEEMPLRDIASFSAMISGYVQNGNHKHALLLFRSMVMNENEGLRPDGGIAVSVLSSCAHMGTHGLLLGKSVHGFMVKNHWELNVELGTTLVDMYAKCRSLKGAARVFELMQERMSRLGLH
ncbi:pentatricopeptide repeat-containing protein [Prunus yedoensis var. nudiflora]|uniref:Pentatricopeptide repeat-containing protein n=1 Tax=Prunus yedoensis var. nudiflora TaxID=2094558 RepID=A0A314XTH2_PRUYE|nr:pentatricopeptide repeat-containing protein [Prunus yedoensis var. nudiflora]